MVYLALGLYLVPLAVVVVVAVRQSRLMHGVTGPAAAAEPSSGAPRARRPSRRRQPALTVGRLVALSPAGGGARLADLVGEPAGPVDLLAAACCDCPRPRHRRAPARSGRCGLPAVRERQRVEELLRAGRYGAARSGALSGHDAPVLVHLELTGRVLASPRGLRAEQRRVVGIEVLPLCAPCLTGRRARPADLLAARETFAGGAAGPRPLRPVCLDHAFADDAEESMDLAQLAARLGLPGGAVTWMKGPFVEAVRAAAGGRDSRQARG